MRVISVRFLSLFLIVFFTLVASGTAGQITTTFQVNMSIKMREGAFLPGSNDSIWVRGNFNNWGTTLLTDPNNDSIYTGTIVVDTLYNSPSTHAANVGDTILYKYFKTNRAGMDWESVNNRILVITGDTVSTPVDWYNNDSVYVPPANINVTFQVNMSIKMREGAFLPGSGDIVTVRGSFNNWGNSPPGNLDTLTDPNNDSIYTRTISMPGNQTLSYKFWKTLRGGLDWEADPNRSFDVASSDITVPDTWFNRDSVYVPPVMVNVLFQVDMRVKILEGTFQPQSGDIVRVAGSFNSWANSTDTLTDPNNDSIYTKTVQLAQYQAIQYKYLKTLRGGIDWESLPNSQYTVPVGGGSVDLRYFDNDTVVNTAINANINWRVDMGPYITMGWFQPNGGDTLQVRGPFNGWGGTSLTQNAFNPSQYHVVLPYAGTSYDDLPFKFYIKLNPSTAEARFPGYGANGDGIQYDHPAERGDGNRIFNVGTGGNISSPSFYFSSINPGGLIPAGDSIQVTLSVNMGPATRYIIPFAMGSDSLKLIWQDAMWKSLQVKSHGGTFGNLVLSAPSLSDSVYSTTFWVIGPAHYNMQYTYRYIQSGGTTVDQGGGLGGQNLFVTRFIVPNSPGVFPAAYAAPTDQWQKDAPLPGETPPLSTVTGIVQGTKSGIPQAFKLAQNYPNPFNPTTRIDYSVPVRGMVSLTVFNLLGQQVKTLVHEEKSPGNFYVQFDASNLPTGVYYYRMESGSFLNVKKMLLIK
jgi:hypothetical protein